MSKCFAAGFWDVSREAYHADRKCISHSALEVFRRSIPLYHAQFVSGEIVHLPSQAMEFGTALHTFLLEPEQFERQCVVLSQKWDMRTNKGKEAMSRFMEEANGRILLEPQQMESLERMKDTACAHRGARELLEAPGTVERAVRWYDGLTRLPLRCLPDKVIPSKCILDIKTAVDPTPHAFGCAAGSYGYHRQAAFYQEAVAEVFGVRLPFLLLAIGKELPHEVCLYRIGQDTLDAAREQNHVALQELRDCIDFERWGSRYGEAELILDIPAWKF